MLDEIARPQIRSDVQYRELSDGAVVYDTAAERVHTLNITAAYIWNCCDGSHSLDDIAVELLSQVDIAREKALADVRDAITYFQAEGLLQPQ